MKVKKEIPKGALGDNIPRNQKAPDAENVRVQVGFKNSDGFNKVAKGLSRNIY